MSAEFEIDGKTYKAADLDPFKAFTVARKLAPLAKVVTMFGSMAEVRAVVGGADDERALAVVAPVLDIVAGLPDADVDTVLKICLRAVEVRQAAGWAPIMTQAGDLMFDLKMPAMLQIVWRVIQANTRDFFPSKEPTSPQPATQ